VAVFMYMRMIGYPADKISILTTYNGQKHLIRDVIQQRCADNRLIGRPHKVCTSPASEHSCQSNELLCSIFHSVLTVCVDICSFSTVGSDVGSVLACKIVLGTRPLLAL